jgi:hypothetical protein
VRVSGRKRLLDAETVLEEHDGRTVFDVDAMVLVVGGLEERSEDGSGGEDIGESLGGADLSSGESCSVCYESASRDCLTAWEGRIGRRRTKGK